ncbi:MAG: 2-dehydropantoate 2-reductase [Pseudomonadota bacterium]
MRIAIIGAGPIGGILAACLARSGEDVFVVDVDENLVSAIKDGGITLSGPAIENLSGKFTARPAGWAADISELGELDVAFVCTKTTALDRVAPRLKKSWKKGALLVSFQNGIDPEEVLKEVAGEEMTLRAVVNFAGHMTRPGDYSVNFFRPPNYVGPLTRNARGHAERIAALLSKAKLATEAVDDIKSRAYEKTSLNAALCPVCALTSLNMGEAMANPYTKMLATEILKEARDVADRMGLKFQNTLDDWLKHLSIGGTHRTSMAIDMEAGRKTEIEFMNGKICDYGKDLGVPTRFNDAMRWAILGKEQACNLSGGSAPASGSFPTAW